MYDTIIQNRTTEVFFMSIGDNIRQRRCELGMSQRDLAEIMRYNNHSTIGKIENGAVDVSHSRIVQFAEALNVSVEYLIGATSTLEENSVAPELKASNRDVFSSNLRLLMSKAGKSRKEVSEAIDVSYNTFTDWYKGKKYPRIEKMELLANYFGVSVSELVGKHGEEIESNISPRNVKNEVLDVIIRLHTDSEFLELVEKISKLDNEQIKAFQRFLKAFSE